MAKIRGPLLSHGAHGTVANLLTYQETPKGFKAYLKTIPQDTQTIAQRLQREMFTAIRAFYTGPQMVWYDQFQDYADQHGITNANAFTAINLERWSYGALPCWQNPPTANGGGATPLALSGVGHSGYATVTITGGGPPDGFGVAIYRGPTNNFTPSKLNCIKILPSITEDEVQIFDDPAPAGTYFYRATQWSTRGILAGLRTSSSIVVT